MVKKSRPVHQLNVWMNGYLIGRVKKVSSKHMEFSYAQTWLDQPGARPISLSMPLTEAILSGEVVFNFFDNLLPDNPQIRSRIQSKFHIASNHPFDLLSVIGKDCVGAIQLTEEDEAQYEHCIRGQPVDEATITKHLKGYLDYPLGMTDEFDEFRISIAGAQEKTAYLKYKGKWQIPLGQTPTTHLFKLPIGVLPYQQIDLTDSCENEWLCSCLAKAFGLKVAHCEIECFEDQKVLIVERFDRAFAKDKRREWLMRLPQEDICQALGFSYTQKYQADGGPGINSILNLLTGAIDPMKDREDFYRAQVLYWLLAAIDGHAKNTSLFIKAEGQYSLTPLYDILSAHPLVTKKQLHPNKLKMAMALRSKGNHYHWNTVRREHFLNAATYAKFPLKRAEEILNEMLEQVDAVLTNVASELPHSFPAHISDPIFDGILKTKRKMLS